MKSKYVIFLLLLALLGCTTESRRAEMKAVLDRAQQQNLDYDSITNVDSIALAAEFFDSHGTPNEQMRAHYLLGCAYRDMGEAPAALQCYQDAVDCADTLSSDCDYRRLMSVYGQMATLYHSQNLPTDELEANCHVQKCAKQLKDTLMYIRSIELRVRPFFLLRDTTSMLSVLKQAQKLYMKNGFYKEASSVYPSIIDIHIKQDNVRKAKELIDIFEAKSGLFDSEGNISPGRESYYYIKGIYYNKVHNLDSAEYYFRKLIPHHLMADSYSGLLSVYQARMNPDSIVKYVRLYERALKHEQDALQTQIVHQMSSLYNYQRFLKKADSESRRAERESQNAARANNRLLISIIVLLIVFLAASWLYIARRNVIESLEQTATELNGVKTENEVLKQDSLANHRQITENEKRIKQLEKKLGRYGKLVFLGPEKMDNDLKLSPNYQHIQELAKNGRTLSEGDWDVVSNLTSEYHPAFYDYLLSHLKVDSNEYRICLLLRLHFKAGEIANMLGVTPPYISKTSTEIMEALYGKKGSSKDLSKELSKIN